ncbi:1,2-phenylacetyl-CoA epoxidase subunit PaaD [Lentibacillus saliphilus]|uniref:1,2-phenylacetyl-CoA epoxidase subunit PaaD n=1 Tax=Lentibacillus saliphilus TaxID=2737028 RepID=UPI001C2F22D6|nr:1,2-phenylacetyl-CoA epoxidase subunit PaaD [Lentibacillus saliphilus]
MTEKTKRNAVEAVLKTVDDPELPSVSVWDLGMVHKVDMIGEQVQVTMIPTFSGCPALQFIERDVQAAVEQLAWVERCDVAFSMDIPWTTDTITEEGKQQLKKHGISPPPEYYEPGEPWTVDCPYCGSGYTSMENVFGPTACRSILYCMSCRNPFEAMKPVVRTRKTLTQPF